jgi:multiple sugar transport system substrate-binding protein
MSESLKILLVGGPMYDPLYERIGEFEESEGMSVEVTVAPTHPDLNGRIEEEFSSGRASYDLISTHTKYAPSQRQWLTPWTKTSMIRNWRTSRRAPWSWRA